MPEWIAVQARSRPGRVEAEEVVTEGPPCGAEAGWPLPREATFGSVRCWEEGQKERRSFWRLSKRSSDVRLFRL